MKLAVCFTNFGPYHLARLRALASALDGRGDGLIAYEVAGNERRYPWTRSAGSEPFAWATLFPDRDLETIPHASCRRGVLEALDRDEPDLVAIVGYARPESTAMLVWARSRGLPTILMSESQEIDHPRVWWKESIKARRIRACSSGLVGGPRHADYLAKLGLPRDRIALGYNAVDNDHFARLADEARRSPHGPLSAPYFLAVSRFVPEKNLAGLVAAYSRYRAMATGRRWDLVLCGGGPGEADVRTAIRASGVAENIHTPGFLQADGLAPWLAHAAAFVHPSLMEPWGLAVNEAAACGLPLLVSDRAGCVETLVPDPVGTTGRRFDPASVDAMAGALAWIAELAEADRMAMGRRAAAVVSEWGPDRFARGTLEALDLALSRPRRGGRLARVGRSREAVH